jgi:hypothetical protein
MKVTITGTLHEVQPAETFASGSTKQTVIICPNAGSDYPDYLPVEMWKDKIGSFDGIQPGSTVSVNAYLGGREYNGRYYISLKFAELNDVQREMHNQQVYQAAMAPPQPVAQAPKPQAKQLHMEADAGNDLPF